MKKIVGLFALLISGTQAQAQALNEVEWNVLNTIVQQSVELGYKHFIDQDQAIGVDIMVNDRFSYFGENKKTEKYKKFNTNSIGFNYSFFFGGKDGEHASGIFAQPFLKYRFGNYEKAVQIVDGTYAVQELDMNSFILGVGAGYKLVKNDAFTVTPFVNIARNFNADVADEFMAVELNAGINVGYRF